MLERAEAGEEIVIGRVGKPIAGRVPWVENLTVVTADPVLREHGVPVLAA